VQAGRVAAAAFGTEQHRQRRRYPERAHLPVQPANVALSARTKGMHEVRSNNQHARVSKCTRKECANTWRSS
jgi:hypothetical protein